MVPIDSLGWIPLSLQKDLALSVVSGCVFINCPNLITAKQLKKAWRGAVPTPPTDLDVRIAIRGDLYFHSTSNCIKNEGS